MNNLSKFLPFILLSAFIVLSGCKSIQTKAADTQNGAINSQTSPDNKTKITKESLKEHLQGKNVAFTEKISDGKPNPLVLIIKIVAGGSSPKYSLNNTDYAYSELSQKLRDVFKERENNGVFREETNEVDKRVKLAASETQIDSYNKKNIYVEDFEKLIDDLHKDGIDQIEVDFAGANEIKNVVLPSQTPSRSSTPKLNTSTSDAPPPKKSMNN